MKKNLLGIGIIIVITGCRGTPKEARIAWTPPSAELAAPLYRIADHKAKASGEDIPAWLIRYDSGGIPQVEYLEAYQDRYVFIAETSGTNAAVLDQWRSNFQLSLDFAGLVAPRIQNRFTKEIRTFPEQEYGAFFEAVIKTAYDTVYAGAVQEDDFWLKKQYVAEDGVTPDKEIYVFFILVSISKTALQQQIQRILDTAEPARNLTKEQLSAAARLKERFFQFF